MASNFGEAGASEVRNFPVVDRRLQQMMWSGYSRYAAGEFERMKASDTPRDVFDGAWGLARIHYAAGDYERAYAEYLAARRLSKKRASALYFRLYELDLLSRLGKTGKALARAEAFRAELGDGALIRLMRQSILAGGVDQDDVRLELINRIYETAGDLAPLRRMDEGEPLALANIAADAGPVHEGSKVSVIMAAYDDAGSIGMAARSILDQSWRNLELIIVDDASTDGTWPAVEAIAASDPRVVAIRKPVNAGAYAARNTGLAVSTGDYVTANDADDWSHPQRIEVQARDLMAGSAGFNSVAGATVFDDLSVAMRTRGGGIIVENVSSLFVERGLMTLLGGWDEVRFAADSELYNRLSLKTGVDKRVLRPETPLSFIHARPGSLTRSSDTGISTLYYGARRQYREAAAYWHETAGSLEFPAGSRPFPVPAIALDRERRPVPLDLLCVSDFSADSSFDDEVVRRALAGGLRAGLFHVPRPQNYMLDVRRPVRALVHEGRLSMIVSGEIVECRMLLVGDAGGELAMPDRLPEVRAGQCLLASGPEAETESAAALAAALARAGGTSPTACNPRAVLDAVDAMAGRSALR